MSDSTLKDIINAIGYQIEPNDASMSADERNTFERLVAKAFDNKKLSSLSLCYSKAMHEDDKAFFKNEIAKLLSSNNQVN